MIKEWIRNLRKSERTKELLSAALKGETLTTSEREIVAYNVFEGKKLAGVLAGEMNAEKGIAKANNRIKAYVGLEDNVLIDNIRSLIMGVIFRTKSDGELSQRYLSVEGTRRPTI